MCREAFENLEERWASCFFDASHKPCPDSPARFSLWEVHPIYAIDVCKKATLEECPADGASVWTPLDRWLGAE